MKNYLILISIFIVSCEARINDSTKSQKVPIETKIEGQKTTIEIEENIIKIPDSVRINLNDFDIVLSEYLCYNTENLKPLNDTIYLDEEIGFNLDRQLMKIISKTSEDDFEVFVAFQQDLRVYVGEKQVKDLDEWHIRDPYMKLTDSAQFYFRLPSYNYKEKEKEISENLKDIKQAILQLEGEFIDPSLDTVTDLSRLPVEFWISKVFIKIQYVDANKTGKTILLINQSSWGC